MTRVALLPLAALALLACADPATGPIAGPLPRAAISLSFDDANAPNGTHLQVGAPGCTVVALSIGCVSYELAGVGNANAQADLVASFTATVDCTNHGGKLVPVKSQVKGAGVSTGQLEPKNGRLLVPALSTGGDTPSPEQFIAQAVCPNGNWTKSVASGSIELTSFVYTLAFVGFPPSYITLTGP